MAFTGSFSFGAITPLASPAPSGIGRCVEECRGWGHRGVAVLPVCLAHPLAALPAFGGDFLQTNYDSSQSTCNIICGVLKNGFPFDSSFVGPLCYHFQTGKQHCRRTIRETRHQAPISHANHGGQRGKDTFRRTDGHRAARACQHQKIWQGCSGGYVRGSLSTN